MDCGWMACATQETENVVEIVFEHDANALGGSGGAHVVVLVVVMIIGFQAYSALTVEEILDVEVADKLIGIERFVAVTEVAVEQQAVVEQARREGEIDLDI